MSTPKKLVCSGPIELTSLCNNSDSTKKEVVRGLSRRRVPSRIERGIAWETKIRAHRCAWALLVGPHLTGEGTNHDSLCSDSLRALHVPSCPAFSVKVGALDESVGIQNLHSPKVTAKNCLFPFVKWSGELASMTVSATHSSRGKNASKSSQGALQAPGEKWSFRGEGCVRMPSQPTSSTNLCRTDSGVRPQLSLFPLPDP
jgi:hypothetical protein